MTLIEISIVVGIGAIVSLAFATMISNQTRASKQLSEKVAVSDITRAVTTVLSDPTLCTNAVILSGNLTPHTFAVGQTVLMNSVPSTPLALGAPAAPDLAPELKLFPASPTSGLALEITSFTTAKLHVRFDPTNLVIPLHELTFPDIAIVASGSPSAMSITACGPPVNIVMCLKGCGGTWPHTLGGIAMWNWYSHDNTSYYARANYCAGGFTWVFDTVGGGTHAGPPSYGGDSLYLCSR